MPAGPGQAARASAWARAQAQAVAEGKAMNRNKARKDDDETVPLYSLKERQQMHVDKAGLAWEPEGGWDASFSKVLSMLASQKDFYSKESEEHPDTKASWGALEPEEQAWLVAEARAGRVGQCTNSSETDMTSQKVVRIYVYIYMCMY